MTSAGNEAAPPGRIFARFLRFGLLAWGGPVAQIAMLRRELVEEERWLSGDRFNRLLAVYQALPGPEAHELAVHLGMLRGGRIGGLLAGLGFMLPGFVLMFALSWLYFQVDLTQAGIGAALLGAQIAVIALVVRAVQRLGQGILASRQLLIIGLAAGVATFAEVPFWIILPVAGVAHVLASRTGGGAVLLAIAVAAAGVLAWSIASSGGLVVLGASGPTSPVPAAIQPSVADLFLSGLKAGLLTFGGAYTAIPFLRADAVGSGWLTDAQFLDGIALGGVLPAPLIIFSTFVGYVAGGPFGALAVTAGVFLPAFSFSLLLGDRIEAVVDNAGLHRLLEGVAAGVVGLIAVTAVELGLAVAQRVPSALPAVLIFVSALGLLLVTRSRAAIPAVVAGAAVAGWLVFYVLTR
jgi:chromate transporter